MIDFADIWNRTIREHVSARHLAAVDQAFWATKAEANATWTRRTPETIEQVRLLLKDSESLLDVGSGTGRYALQLAPFVERVTALDYSAAMLAQLNVKQRAMAIKNVEAKLGNILTADVKAHDTVLAAWSLYSSADILMTFKHLLSLSNKQLIILDDDSSGSPHRQLRRQLWEPRPPPMPKYLVLTGALWQLGIRADIRVIQETSIMQFSSREAFLSKLCPNDADDASKEYFYEQLSHFLTATSEGLRYAYPFEVVMIHWRRTGSNTRF